MPPHKSGDDADEFSCRDRARAIHVKNCGYPVDFLLANLRNEAGSHDVYETIAAELAFSILVAFEDIVNLQHLLVAKAEKGCLVANLHELLLSQRINFLGMHQQCVEHACVHQRLIDLLPRENFVDVVGLECNLQITLDNRWELWQYSCLSFRHWVVEAMGLQSLCTGHELQASFQVIWKLHIVFVSNTAFVAGQGLHQQRRCRILVDRGTVTRS
mmetsp:Transcript_96974/g.177378  ORF Transcript_96974/g.177378 Transcript_96974/m.177378 type:complete len:215 (-) Transcript_96974:86-730(-)